MPRIADEPHDGTVSILAYVDRYPPMVNAGAEWMLHSMLRDSVRRGHRVRVATGCVKEPTVVEGVEVYPARDGRRLADEAHVLVGHLLWTNEAIRLATGAELPLLYLVHNDSQIRYWRLHEPKVSAYVWNSEWVAAKCSGDPEAAGVPGTIVRPPLVAADYALPGDAAEREFVTLVNPIDAKGADVFYRLAELHPERRFLAVEGAYGSQRRPQARHRNVEWQPQTGSIRDDVLARTRVLLVGSSYESWGRIAVEACAAGVPVISTPTPGLREALGEDWPMFAPFGDVSAWGAALVQLDDPATFARVAAAGLARAAMLDELGQFDLDRWDRLCRMGARATIERRGPDPVSAQPLRSPERSLSAPESGPVPEIASAVVEWVRAAQSPAERLARAERAWEVESSRPGGVRRTVAQAVRARTAS